MAASDGSGTRGSSAADRDRVKASIENWKRKLLDLSKRNRALNFKVNKVSTITIVDEQPVEVFRQLYLKEQNMRFRAAPEDASQKANTGNEAIDPEADAEPRLVLSVTPPSSTEESFEPAVNLSMRKMMHCTMISFLTMHRR